MGRWHQLAITGSDKALRGFIAGFEAGRGKRLEVAFGADLGIEPSSLAGRLRELIAPGSSLHAIYCSPATAVELVQALGARGGEVGLTVRSQGEVLAASFSFQVETFSADVARAIREQFLDSLPEGVERLDYRADETIHADAEGAELYAPDHRFEFRISGTFRGPFPAVVELHRRAHTFEHVTATPLALDVSGV